MLVNEQSKGLAALGVMLLAATEALAQETTRPVRRVVISLPDRRLALLEDGRVLKIYPIAVGAPRTPTPAGDYQVVHRIPDPTWYTRGKIVEPGPANPLGTRWLGLNVKGYGIHGTNNPRSIGKRASHGCIRMRNADVEELFELLDTGDSVEVAGRRTAEIEALFAPPPDAAPAQVARASASHPGASELE